MKIMELLEKIGIARADAVFYIGGSDVLPPPLKGKEELDALEAFQHREYSQYFRITLDGV